MKKGKNDLIHIYADGSVSAVGITGIDPVLSYEMKNSGGGNRKPGSYSVLLYRNYDVPLRDIFCAIEGSDIGDLERKMILAELTQDEISDDTDYV